MNIEIKDIDEAAYYIMHGAKYISSRSTKVQESKLKKSRSKYIWHVTLDTVSPASLVKWRQGKPTENIREYMNFRDKLKVKIKRDLGLK